MEFKTKPWVHQLKTSKYLSEERVEPYYGLLWDMGTGKTKQACDILRIACFQKNAVPYTLIVCPVVVLENWKREIKLHTNIPITTVAVIDGITKIDGKKNKNPTKTLKLKQLEQKGKQIFIISTETVDGKEGSIWQELIKLPIEMLVIDEVHNFKNPTGKRTKALHKFTNRPELKYRYILTGTPVLQNALDLWSQFYILNPKILGSNYFAFRSKYFYDKNANMPSHVHFPNFVPKDKVYFKRFGFDPRHDGNEDTLNEIIYKHASRVMKTDVLDLPDMVYQRLDVPLNSKTRKMYDEFKKDLVVFLDSKDASQTMLESLDLDDFEIPDVMRADLAIVKTIRLQQLICGIFTNDQGEVTLLDSSRLKTLKDTLELLTANKENKIIIWTVFKSTYDQLENVCKEIGIEPVFITGLQSKDEKLASEDAFNNDPNTRILIANQGAGGTGVNLTGGNYSIYYSRSFNLAHDLQSEARNYRGGQTRKVTRIDLVTPETIDEYVLAKLKEKHATAENILENKEFSRKEVLGLLRK